jgi:hypothetical protein
MSQRHSGYPRQPDDEYETPAWVTRAVAPYLRCSRAWDPANGASSKLALTLRQEGFKVVTTTDDFLSRDSLPHRRIDGIVTNPPYGNSGRTACQFIEHALALSPFVAMLLRVDFDSGKTRVSLFRNCKAFARKVVLLDRIMWFPGDSGPSTNHAWFIWDARHRGPATNHYVQRAAEQREHDQ